MPEAGYCQKATSGIEHAEALKRVCEFSLTLQKKLPDVICQRTLKSYNDTYLSKTVSAEVRHQNGRDSYSKVMLNGKPFPGAMSQLPGSWEEGEFGSVLQFVFREESRGEFRFDKEARWRARPVLLFGFHVAANNNRGWYVEANRQKVYPGFKGKLWIDEATGAILRAEMEAEHLDRAAEAAPVMDSPEVRPQRPRRPFLLQSVKLSVEYANQHLGDGTEFVLPITSEDEKGVNLRFCIRDQVRFENCHKFGAKARIVEDATR